MSLAVVDPHWKHLVPFLPELHTFTVNIGAKLVQEDRVVVYEAIAHVISAMPMDQAAQSLKTFATSILAAVFTVANKPTAVTKQELQEVGSASIYYVPRLCTEAARRWPNKSGSYVTCRWVIWRTSPSFLSGYLSRGVARL
jgi:hypothetical protein